MIFCLLVLKALSKLVSLDWTVPEESRRKEISGLGVGMPLVGLGVGGAFIHDTGKAHQLVVPYVDENGVPQQPTFGVSSFRGRAIRDWASELYIKVVDAKATKKKQELMTSPSASLPSLENNIGSKNMVDKVGSPYVSGGINDGEDIVGREQKIAEKITSKSAAPITIFGTTIDDENGKADIIAQKHRERTRSSTRKMMTLYMLLK